MKSIVTCIFFCTISLTICYSQKTNYLDIGAWKVELEKDREFTIKIVSPNQKGNVSSLVEYHWDDVIIFKSEKANRNSYITVENNDGKELKKNLELKNDGLFRYALILIL